MFFCWQHRSCFPRFSGFKRSQLPHPEGLQLRGDQEAAVGVRGSETTDQTWKTGRQHTVKCRLHVCFSVRKLTVISISVSSSSARKVHCYDIWEEEHQNKNVHRNRCFSPTSTLITHFIASVRFRLISYCQLSWYRSSVCSAVWESLLIYTKDLLKGDFHRIPGTKTVSFPPCAASL